MSGVSSLSRRSSASLSQANGPALGAGGSSQGQFGRFTGRLDEQERELKELKEERSALEQRVLALENWKGMIEAWVLDYFGEDLSSGEVLKDKNTGNGRESQVVKNGSDDVFLNGRLTPEGFGDSAVEMADTREVEIDTRSSKVDGSMNDSGRRSRSPRHGLESPQPQRKRVKRDSDGSADTVMISRNSSSPIKKKDNQSYRNRSQSEDDRSPRPGSMQRAVDRKSPAVGPKRNLSTLDEKSRLRARNNKDKDSDADELMDIETEDQDKVAETENTTTPKAKNQDSSPEAPKSSTLWKLKPFREPFGKKKSRSRSSKVDKERAEAAVAAVTDATAYEEFLADSNEESEADQDEKGLDKDSKKVGGSEGMVEKETAGVDDTRDSNSDIQLLDDIDLDETLDIHERKSSSRKKDKKASPIKRKKTEQTVQEALEEEDEENEDDEDEKEVENTVESDEPETLNNQTSSTTVTETEYPITDDENCGDPGEPCAVCNEPWWEDDNKMIMCEKCDIYVHQFCYGVTVLPEGNWFCAPCSRGLKPADLECHLCGHNGGALKTVSSPKKDKWAHVHCAQWVPNVGFGSAAKLEPVTGLDKVEKARWKLLCKICKNRKGAPIQCSDKRCKTAFHPFCAKKEGLFLRMDDPGGDDDLIMTAYCESHRKDGGKASKQKGSKKGGKARSPKKKSGGRKSLTATAGKARKR